VSELWVALNYRELSELMRALDKASYGIKEALDKAASDPDHCKPHVCVKLDCKNRVAFE